MIADNQKQFLLNRIVDELTYFLMQDNGFSISEALKFVYASHTYELLQNSCSDLYVQSPSYVYEILKKELFL